MTRHIGDVYLPNTNLRYYLLGNPKRGYCAKIVAYRTEEACGVISKDYRTAEAFVRKMHRNVVFPGNLAEHLVDFKFSNHSY